MPRLIGTMARTAVIAGTATHVSNNVSRRQANRWAEQEQQQYAQQQYAQQQEYAQQQQYAAQQAAAAAPAAEDPIARLKELAGLRDAGVLTEQEFAAAKAKILG